MKKSSSRPNSSMCTPQLRRCAPRLGAAPLPLSMLMSLFAFASVPGARAEDCWVDDSGDEVCTPDIGVRIGIAAGVIGGVLILFGLVFWFARRRHLARQAAAVPHSYAPAPVTYAQYPPPQQSPQVVFDSLPVCEGGYDLNGDYAYAVPPGPQTAHVNDKDGAPPAYYSQPEPEYKTYMG
ncbi:hypothetical protein DENSPDRAFT_511141 [Dentipellis sp. KUC8613]|nr:hypothetical protein DENSPDRAFT_511141 [Dentipellis sp. KUC8613]